MEEILGDIMKKKPSKLSITLTTDDIKNHRYKSIDDYFDPVIDDDTILFNTYVADMGNPDFNFLVFMHAITEQYLCFKHKIKDKDITAFDIQKGKEDPDDEPGDDIEAPYHKEHMVGNDIEAILSVALGIKWEDYEKAIDRTVSKWRKR